jgi:putative MATE family efflux protein
MMLNMIILSAANFFEGWIAGRLGAVAQSAVGIGSQVWFLIMLLTLALSAGTMSMLSRYYGAGDRQATIDGARQSLLLAAIFGSGMTVVSFICVRPLLAIFGASPEVTECAWTYLMFTSISALPYTVLWISNSVFRSIGDSRTPLMTIVIVNIVMIALDFLLCLKPIGLGVAGIGLSWLVSSLLGIAINVVAIKRSILSECLERQELRKLRVSKYWLKEYLSIGLPACMQDISIVLSSFGVFYLLGQLINPIEGQAAWAVGWRLEETITIMPMYGLNMAAAIIVGQNIGAGKMRRAKNCGWQLLAFSVLITTIGAVLFGTFANKIAAFMTEDPQVAAGCADYIKTLCWTEPLLAVWLVLSGAMQGTGATARPMIVTIISFDILRLALSWWLSSSLGLGAHGVWLGMAVSTTIAALWMVRVWHNSKLGDDSLNRIQNEG